MNGVRRVVLLVGMLCVALAVTVAGAGAKPGGGKPSKSKGGDAGELDSSFGKGGKVSVAFPAENNGSTGPKYELPFEFTPGHLEMAQAPGGKVVVAGATKVVRYLASGKLDKSFGSGGSVTIPRPPGGVFVLAGVAVDSFGRIYLAGLVRPLPSNAAPDPVVSSAAVIRLAANGTPDVSFGSGGTLITNFGFPPPKEGGGSYIGPSVGLRDIVVDAENRPVITGGYVTELTGSGRSAAVSRGFVARLTETGVLDSSFGGGGILTISNLAGLGQIAARPTGYLALATGTERPYNLLSGLDANGNLDSSFGSFGFRTLSFPEAPALTVAPSGKILLLGRPEKSYRYKRVKRKNKDTGEIESVKVRVPIRVQTLQRLLPSGASDPGLNRTGTINYIDPKLGSFSALAADGKERIYLAGRIGKRLSKSPHHTFKRTTFLLGRTLPTGSVDRSFGKEGDVTTGFGGPTSSFATQVMFDPAGRILVGGGIVSAQLGSGGGFAIARYLPGS